MANAERAVGHEFESAGSRRVAERVHWVNRQLARRGVGQRLVMPEPGVDQRDGLSARLLRELSQTSDRDVFQLLYEINVWSVYALAFRLRPPGSAFEEWDVVEETFLRVFQFSGSFRSDRAGAFTRWLNTIATNVVRDQERRARRDGCYECDLPDLVDPADGPIADVIAEECREVARSCWGTVVSLCAAALLKLPPRWQQMIEMREVQGFTYRRIARELKVSPSTVSMTLYRARRQVVRLMTRALKPYEELP